eukprot:scaffold1178_cov252-Pinguiococcus_pyrenoidosus.AAC.21
MHQCSIELHERAESRTQNPDRLALSYQNQLVRARQAPHEKTAAAYQRSPVLRASAQAGKTRQAAGRRGSEKNLPRRVREARLALQTGRVADGAVVVAKGRVAAWWVDLPLDDADFQSSALHGALNPAGRKLVEAMIGRLLHGHRHKAQAQERGFAGVDEAEVLAQIHLGEGAAWRRVRLRALRRHARDRGRLSGSHGSEHLPQPLLSREAGCRAFHDARAVFIDVLQDVPVAGEKHPQGHDRSCLPRRLPQALDPVPALALLRRQEPKRPPLAVADGNLVAPGRRAASLRPEKLAGVSRTDCRLVRVAGAVLVLGSRQIPTADAATFQRDDAGEVLGVGVVHVEEEVAAEEEVPRVPPGRRWSSRSVRVSTLAGRLRLDDAHGLLGRHARPLNRSKIEAKLKKNAARSAPLHLDKPSCEISAHSRKRPGHIGADLAAAGHPEPGHKAQDPIGGAEPGAFLRVLLDVQVR